MTRPFILLQLSDSHVGAEWGGRDPVARLRRAVEMARGLPDAPDAVLLSGDLTDNGLPEEYAAVRDALEALGAPFHVLPGNHDLRAPLRSEFGLEGEPEDPIEYAVDLGPLRLVVVDTIVPGRDHGCLDEERLARLEARLGEDPERPTVIALHHPPLASGIAAWDEINLTRAEREAFGAVVARSPGVRATVGGHLHRAMAGAAGGRPVVAVPSVYVQVEPEFGVEEPPRVNAEPPAFAVHVFREGELSSQIVPFAA